MQRSIIISQAQLTQNSLTELSKGEDGTAQLLRLLSDPKNVALKTELTLKEAETAGKVLKTLIDSGRSHGMGIYLKPLNGGGCNLSILEGEHGESPVTNVMYDDATEGEMDIHDALNADPDILKAILKARKEFQSLEDLMRYVLILFKDDVLNSKLPETQQMFLDLVRALYPRLESGATDVPEAVREIYKTFTIKLVASRPTGSPEKQSAFLTPAKVFSQVKSSQPVKQGDDKIKLPDFSSDPRTYNGKYDPDQMSAYGLGTIQYTDDNGVNHVLCKLESEAWCEDIIRSPDQKRAIYRYYPAEGSISFLTLIKLGDFENAEQNKLRLGQLVINKDGVETNYKYRGSDNTEKTWTFDTDFLKKARIEVGNLPKKPERRL